MFEHTMCCVPTLQDHDCQIELGSSVCSQLDSLIREKTARDPPYELSMFKTGTASSKPTVSQFQPQQSTNTSSSIPNLRRFKKIVIDGETHSNYHGNHDRMLVILHRQAVCYEIASSERRHESIPRNVSKEDVKKIYFE
jgi:hypothetical protein